MTRRYGIVYMGPHTPVDEGAIASPCGGLWCETYRENGELVCYDHYSTMEAAIEAIEAMPTQFAHHYRAVKLIPGIRPWKEKKKPEADMIDGYDRDDLGESPDY